MDVAEDDAWRIDLGSTRLRVPAPSEIGHALAVAVVVELCLADSSGRHSSAQTIGGLMMRAANNDDRARDDLAVKADRLLSLGHPLGDLLTAYVHRWLHGEYDGLDQRIRDLRAASDTAKFRRLGGSVWAPRKAKVGDNVLVSDERYVITGDVWTDTANKRKLVRAEPPSERYKWLKPRAGARTWTATRAPDSETSRGPWNEIPDYRSHVQGDLLARREQSERDRGR